MKSNARVVVYGLVALALAGAGHASAADGLRGLVHELSEGARQAGIARVAVLPFAAVDSSAAEAGWRVSERLVSGIVREGRVETVERALIGKIMGERRLVRSKAFDNESIRAVGKLATVNGIVTGIFAARGRKIWIAARIIDVRSGVVVAVAQGEFDGGPIPMKNEAPAAIDLDAPPSGASCAEIQAKVDRLESLVMGLKCTSSAILGIILA